MFTMWRIVYSALLIYLAVEAAKDIRCRKISAVPALAGCAAAAVFWLCRLKELQAAWLLGMVPGICLLLAAKLTKEAVGYGDGLVLTVSGLWLGMEAAVGILYFALLLTCPVSLFKLIIKKESGKSELPFVPFLLAGYLLWLPAQIGNTI